MSDVINWSRMSLDELIEFYETEIADEMYREGMSPATERPSYEWLVNHGYSGIAYTLREHHDLTLKQFIVEKVGVDADADDGTPGYEWGISDEQTIDRFETYLRDRQRRQNLADTTIRSKRTRLARYAREYEALHGEVTLVDRVGDRDCQPEEIERVLSVFDVLDDELASNDSKAKHHYDVNDWYVWLQNRAIGTYNPSSTVSTSFGGWDTDTEDGETKPALQPDQLREILAVCDDREDRLLVVALGAWGLRRGEVAALQVSQFIPNAEPPRIEFEDRKNGPSSVQLLYGVEDYLDRVEALDESGWNGHLFPSNAAESGHIAPGTVNNRFERLVDAAGVTLNGERPTPHACRRFWYNAYQDAMRDLQEQVAPMAADQGSSSAAVVVDKYLSEEQARRARHDAMHERLAAVFESET
ncbi:tyrosine-type recombinase/integrase [Halorubrum trueperi]|uniref:Tyrosine-type recombinase/integrase n=1 Tax=Halorubrum trueperi TaxID=2004704 RepID=A0ABD5UJ67_9EURY